MVPEIPATQESKREGKDGERPMGDGARLAIAILVLFLAMVAFFFAFHPGGVEGANNPADVLKFMFNQFDNTANGTNSSTTNSGATAGPGPNTSVSSVNLTNVPGTNLGPGT